MRPGGAHHVLEVTVAAKESTAAGQLQLNSLLPMLAYGTGRIIERSLETRLEEAGLTLRTLGILGHLANNPRVSYSSLARRADVTVQTMHVTVKRLLADGVVEGETTAGTAAQLRITKRGRAQLMRAREILSLFEVELLAASGIDKDATTTALLSLAQAAWKLSNQPPL